MSEEGGSFDPCECVWGHELAMRRLLNVVCFYFMPPQVDTTFYIVAVEKLASSVYR